jgi:UDP-GlcNAc:undecaprenyl-phosphate/decaprenyl-phosphate GlcNAc-1-phosphate transferase
MIPRLLGAALAIFVFGVTMLSASPLPLVPPSPEIRSQIHDLVQRSEEISRKTHALATSAGVKFDAGKPSSSTRLDVFHGYVGVFVVAFLVTLLATPLMRRLAIDHGVVDRPKEARKVHRVPIAYLGGVAVYLGIIGAIIFAYASPFHGLIDFHATQRQSFEFTFIDFVMPWSILAGATVIMLAGLIDDVVGLHPRLKIASMLLAAAALAYTNIGVKVSAGLLLPIAHQLGIPTASALGVETILLPLPLGLPSIDIIYWVGTGVIAVFVLGACNASNLIDGLDGLLSGTTAIAQIGLLVLALGLAVTDDGLRDASRIILCLSVLGACLGFLPHNFNPANIFLGDTGSLLLGYCTIVVVLMLGDTGKTHLVLAGLVIYAVPIIDTTLAIVRRKISGKKISDADDQHLHHMLKRALGVKGAVLSLYAIAAGFGLLGVLMSEGRLRIIYALAMIFAAFIGVTAFKIARKSAIEAAMVAAEAERERRARIDQLGEAQASVSGPAPAASAIAAGPVTASGAGPNGPLAPAASLYTRSDAAETR